MPNWKKLITSGSDAHLNSLNVNNEITASAGLFNTIESGFVYSTSSYALTASYATNTGVVSGYNHTQAQASTTWNISHSLGTQTPIITVYDQNYDVIIPNTISNVDENTTIVGFTYNQAGFATISSGDGISRNNILTSSFAISASWAPTPDVSLTLQDVTTLGNETTSSIKIGVGNTVGNDYAVAQGFQTTANAQYGPHAEGYRSQAIGIYSHAEGYLSTAKGEGSHAEGDTTQALGILAHSEGQDTIAIGNGSHSEGYFTTAKGNWSHAAGFMTIANAQWQQVMGRYNTEDTSAWLVVGAGTATNARKNILSVYSDSVVVSGSIDTEAGAVVTNDHGNTYTPDPITKIVSLTQAEYDAITPDSNTLYIII